MFKMENTKRFVNDVVVFLIVFVIFVVAPALGDTIQHNYSQTCEVYEVTTTETIFVDPVGYLWTVSDINYTKGETVKVYFHDNFTDFNRTDDIIKKVKRVD